MRYNPITMTFDSASKRAYDVMYDMNTVIREKEKLIKQVSVNIDKAIKEAQRAQSRRDRSALRKAQAMVKKEAARVEDFSYLISGLL